MRTAENPAQILLDRRGTVDVEVLIDQQQAPSDDHGSHLCCRNCTQRIAEPDARIRCAGSHQHRFINPHGQLFEIGCFSDTVSSRLHGPAISEHSWFAGYAWRIALCAGCGTHLGWRYEDGGEPFYGLILQQLVECREGRQH